MVVRNKKDMSSIMTGFGTWSDMTITLKDGTKIIVPERYTRTERKRKILNEMIKQKNYTGLTVIEA